ncbi:MAG: thiamine-phosphate kinase [Pseudomonadota bacterium]
MKEAEFLEALRTLPLHPGSRGLRDDCALIEIGDEILIFNHDMMAEDTHFRPDADLADVAWKLVAVNLSDLASKGAEPVGFLLGHALGKDDTRFLTGLREVLAVYNVPLMGGDTIAATGASTFGMTAIGRATCRPVPSRRGAKPGDAVYVTGPVGLAMLGFEGKARYLGAFNRPRPRLSEGQALAPLVTAMMDTSDGLLLDCFRLAELNEVTFRLVPDAIPVADHRRLDDCVRWGDDYELLFTAPPGASLPVSATRIGMVDPAGDAPLLLGATPMRMPEALGYQHG